MTLHVKTSVRQSDPRIAVLEEAARIMKSFHDDPALAIHREAVVGGEVPYLRPAVIVTTTVVVLEQAAACLRYQDSLRSREEPG